MQVTDKTMLMSTSRSIDRVRSGLHLARQLEKVNIIQMLTFAFALRPETLKVLLASSAVTTPAAS